MKEVGTEGFLIGSESQFIEHVQSPEGRRIVSETAQRIVSDPAYREQREDAVCSQLSYFRLCEKRPELMHDEPLEIERQYIMIRLLADLVPADVFPAAHRTLGPLLEIIKRTQPVREGYLSGKVRPLRDQVIITSA